MRERNTLTSADPVDTSAHKHLICMPLSMSDDTALAE
jgi:hypothetical protein